MPGECLARGFQCRNSMFHPEFSCRLMNFCIRTSWYCILMLENTAKLERKDLTLLCTRLWRTKSLTSPSCQSEQESWLLKFCFLRVTELDTPKWLTSWWNEWNSLQAASSSFRSSLKFLDFCLSPKVVSVLISVASNHSSRPTILKSPRIIQLVKALWESSWLLFIPRDSC